ncbi:MAG: threonylcarbamoyl-AMP synthase [Deltaproteobacteria bacterium]|nr:threonylcarbamoyl-AMP synthase [Deltaproteobacteria bacterium]
MPAPVIRIDSEQERETALERAGEVILSGGVVAVPTESFYGLAVNALDETAIHRLFRVKGRREDHPVLILIPSEDVLERYVSDIPDTARRLMRAFWPGGLTMLFGAGPRIPAPLTAGTGKIGVRLSSHPVAAGLARAVGLPVTGTSANLTGRPPCVRAGEVLQALGEAVDLILDAGETPGGRGSTVLDVTLDPPVVLREGMVGREALEGVIPRGRTGS